MWWRPLFAFLVWVGVIWVPTLMQNRVVWLISHVGGVLCSGGG